MVSDRLVRAVDVLLVEDEPAAAESTAEVLESAGFSVAVAPTVLGAQEVKATSAVGCIILDHHLADESAEGLLESTNQLPPIIVLSGMGQRELAITWHQHAERLFACLPKPVPPRHLIDVVRAAIEPVPDPAAARPPRPWDVGTWVYARDRRTGVWSGGFAIADVLDQGYRLRRLWEGDVLDDVFRHDDVRPERRDDPFR